MRRPCLLTLATINPVPPVKGCRMANEEHLALLKQGVETWNKWRKEKPDIQLDLRKADLIGADLRKADLRKADLWEANLTGANLTGADLSGADLSTASLFRANLSTASLFRANLSTASLSEADLRDAELNEANLWWANLGGANLSKASLIEANLSGANLSEANLQHAVLVRTNLTNANLAGCRIYGISTWDLKLEGAKQENLIITDHDQAEITVDNIEVAQFIYLLLHNEKIRHVIDTITSKAVLILGRFTPERKAILDALRDELRQRNRTPIVFDFSGPRSKNTTDTVKLLAQMARYIIIDLSDPNSAPYELGVISMLGLKTTPVVPIILSGQKPFPMLDDVLQERWSTDLITYRDLNNLQALLDGRLVSAAEAKVLELRGPQPG
jgi:uncharacterized protein YjbI with pentapeptide repeats